MPQECYTENFSVNAYTDGTTANDIQNEGPEVCAKTRQGITQRWPTDGACTNGGALHDYKWRITHQF